MTEKDRDALGLVVAAVLTLSFATWWLSMCMA